VHAYGASLRTGSASGGCAYAFPFKNRSIALLIQTLHQIFGSPVRVKLWFSRGKITNPRLPRNASARGITAALHQRHAIVIVRVQDQDRRLGQSWSYFSGEASLVEIVQEEALKIVRMPICAVTRAIVTDEVENSALCHRGFVAKARKRM
jgi:hypothetical protein